MFDLIVGLVERFGYLGVGLLMLLENLFPPIPSELIMPLAGFTAARGELSLPGVILAGTAGSVVGALPWYFAARAFGADRLKRFAERHGRWLTLEPKEIDGALGWFSRHGVVAVLAGRLLPGIRTLISIPAGIARMNLGLFLALTAAGSAVWAGALALAGHMLESQYEKVAEWVNPVSTLIFAAALAVYLYRVATRRPSGAA